MIARRIEIERSGCTHDLASVTCNRSAQPDAGDHLGWR